MDWSKLLNDALSLLKQGDISKNEWSLGGGTVLMFQYKHRRSKDIDIFFQSPKLLDKIMPNVNNALGGKELFYERFRDADIVKINMPYGDIDFIVSPTLTNCPSKAVLLNGETIFAQHPVEIAAKKYSIDLRGSLCATFTTFLLLPHTKKKLLSRIKRFSHQNPKIFTKEYVNYLLKNQPR